MTKCEICGEEYDTYSVHKCDWMCGYEECVYPA